MKKTRFALVAVFGQLAVCAHVHAQSLSLSVAALKTTYSEDQYDATRGDWQSEVVVRYHTRGLWRIGAGAEVGKFDEAYSDPSFTSVGAFVEPSIGVDLSDRWESLLGLRYGWQHERVGEESEGLWAWGWQASAVAGINYRIGESTALGLQADATRLDLRRDADVAIPASGLDREGWRFGIGAAIHFGRR